MTDYIKVEKEIYDASVRSAMKYKAECYTLEKQLEIATEALKKYGYGITTKSTNKDGPYIIMCLQNFEDGGVVAREALEKIELLDKE